MNSLLSDSFELPRRDSSRDADIGMGMHQADAFFKKVDAIEGLIAKLTNLLTKLQTANEESKAVTRASDMKAIKQRMEKDIDEVGKIARLAKTKVDELEKDNLSREQTTGAVKKKLKERMDDFQALREAIRQEYRELVERRVHTVTGNRPDEETIDDMIENGKSEQLLIDAIKEQGRRQILDTVAEIQERHDAKRALEKELLELQQIFLDMAVLVEDQGRSVRLVYEPPVKSTVLSEQINTNQQPTSSTSQPNMVMINNIETRVSNATPQQNAKKLQKNSRKWMWPSSYCW